MVKIVFTLSVLKGRCFIGRGMSLYLDLRLRQDKNWWHAEFRVYGLGGVSEELPNIGNRTDIGPPPSKSYPQAMYRLDKSHQILHLLHRISPLSLRSSQLSNLDRIKLLYRRLTITFTSSLHVSILTLHPSLHNQEFNIKSYLKIWEANLPAHNNISYPSPNADHRLGTVVVTHYHVYSNGFMQREQKTAVSSEISFELCKVLVEAGRFRIWSESN